ncbi:DNA primase [Waddlia chondrophila 2032/99]|uniref:DNA primase n=1 Tax=Waddlia chondrophila 2032/99 TaxID=765953 RepID=F8LCF3_9BACT|nr:DNA primase [Waddlia chondrophila 2032/99]
MRLFTQESLERLRSRVDLIDVLSSHMELKRSGSAYKGLCPFHDEKTPSFIVQKGERHYHCFGCGEHGDAIKFLMTYLNLGFQESVESLAERFHVHLDCVEAKDQYTGPSKAAMKEAMEIASCFFHFILLHTQEGHEALHYLYSRGVCLEFIKQFRLGLAPKVSGMLHKVLHEKKIGDDVMRGCGLLTRSDSGKTREFFSDRITFPIYHPSGSVIGFSARKYREETFGGKYVNTPETPLFKKSRVLFGLNHCRRRIVKERRVIIVEGQIDALRLIYEGFNFVVAAQGTAFGIEHAAELAGMGVNLIYLAFDSDDAGREAAAKVGDLFQMRGIEVRIVSLPGGTDPDTFLMEKGPEAFQKLMEKGQGYLEFLVGHLSRGIAIDTPAGKNHLVKHVSEQLRKWEDPVMVHESLRKLARLLQVPEEYLGVGQEYLPNTLIRKSASVGFEEVDPEKILELDFLRWLIVVGSQEFVEIAQFNLHPGDLRHEGCRRLYQTYLTSLHNHLPSDLLSLIQTEEDQELVAELMSRKVNREKGKEQFAQSIQRILDRNWMEKREEIRRRIHSGQLSDEEALSLLKTFDELKRSKPEVNHGTASPVL